ncbi:MAG: Rieske (2Fe-2S) protein [Bacteroidales bacterium]
MMERKQFLKNLVINGSMVFVLPSLVLKACEKEGPNGLPTEGFELDLNDSSYVALSETGGYVILEEYGIIIIRTGETEYVALSSICTHQGCTIGYNPSSNSLPCPCHGSIFDIDGSVLSGPAPTPLKIYETTLLENILIIN